jgi:phosphate-selective porin
MKKLKHIAFASVLALALSATAFAGDITVHKAGDITVGKSGDITVVKSGDITVGKKGDITVGLIGIIQTIINIIP